MKLKRVGWALLFPPSVLLWILAPLSISLLVYAMVVWGSESPLAILSCVLAAYTLTAICLRIPRILRFWGDFRERYIKPWMADARRDTREKISLYSALLFNGAYALLQLSLGLVHGSFWFYSLAGYYTSLAVMRFFLLRYVGRHRAGEALYGELVRYRACGIVFLLMNLALSLMIFFMVYRNRSFHHHEITAITLAAYTFTALTVAIVNAVRGRRYQSPIRSAARAISLAAAAVSVLTLESTLLTVFGDGTMDLAARRWLLGLSGAAVSAFVIAMAVYMIRKGTKGIRNIKYGTQ